MKLLIVIILSILLYSLFQTRFINPLSRKNLPSPTPLARRERGISIMYDAVEYLLYIQLVNPADLQLIPNFTEKKSAKLLLDEHACLYGANAGFYTPEHTPVGLFYTKEQTHDPIISSLLNGFVYIAPGLVTITDAPLDFQGSDWQYAFQSGPLFATSEKLKIKNDERARRILIAETDKSEHYIIALTEKESTNSGPYLSEVPLILAKAPIAFTRAINLDGGSASAFFNTDGVNLYEITPIGSFLCGK